MTHSFESDRQRIEDALRFLTTHNFDVKPLWRDLADRTAQAERGTPTEDDARYVLPTVAPDIATHLVDGTPQDLHPSVMWMGYHYSLTPGQRSILRDTYGLTPTQTVTVDWVEPWPGTLHPRVMKLRSDLHVDPRNRKHVLISAVIKDVGTFFKNAAQLDAADRVERTFTLTVGNLALGTFFTLESIERWAIEDITGVVVQSRVEITGVSDDRFTVLCQKTGNVAKVPRAEYFKTVDEYWTIHKNHYTKRRKASTSSTAAQARTLLDVIAQLSS